MLSILFNWLYIGLTTFCLGYGFSVLIEKTLKYRLKRLDSLLMTGIIIATVYAQIFSLFAGVGLWANVILVAVCVGICIMRKVSVGLKSMVWYRDLAICMSVLLTIVLHLQYRHFIV